MGISARSLDIIVPCYNEAECVSVLFAHIKSVLDNIENLRWSVLYINDGSRDQTLMEIEKLEKIYGKEQVKYVSFSRNFGKEAAIYAGLSYSQADYIALMDADLQHPPELLPKMVAVLDEGYDCCGARRVDRRGEPVVRSALSRLFYNMINRLTTMHLVQGGSDFRMIKRPVAEAMLALGERERFTKGILSWVGFSTKWIEYENVPRAAGTTKWSMRGLMRYAVNGFFAFATTPLRAAVWLGILIDSFTLIGAIWFIITTLKSNGPRTGFGTLVILIAFFGGTIIMILGVIGEYLARIYLEVKKRPLYIVRTTNIENEDDHLTIR
mgnify:FL=1